MTWTSARSLVGQRAHQFSEWRRGRRLATPASTLPDGHANAYGQRRACRPQRWSLGPTATHTATPRTAAVSRPRRRERRSSGQPPAHRRSNATARGSAAPAPWTTPQQPDWCLLGMTGFRLLCECRGHPRASKSYLSLLLTSMPCCTTCNSERWSSRPSGIISAGKVRS